MYFKIWKMHLTTSTFFSEKGFYLLGILLPIWLWYMAVTKPNVVSALFDSNLQHSRPHKIDHECSHCELFPKFPTHYTE